MSLTLQLRPEVQEQVVAEAAVHGLSVEDYVACLIEGRPVWRQPLTTLADPDQFEAELRQFEADMDSLSEGSELLPAWHEVATSREAIYADHD